MGSSLGKALSMTSSTSWNDVVTKIKSVTIGTRSVSQSITKDYWLSGDNTFLTRIDVDATGVYNNGYNSGRTQGQNDVKNNPNSYSLYTKSQYDANWSNGYNNGRSNIKITSGSYSSTSRKYFTINGSNANRAYGTINPGGNPMAVIAYDPNRNDTFVIRFGSSWMCSCKFQYGVNMNECSWTSSAIDLPQTTASTHNMKWYAAVY